MHFRKQVLPLLLLLRGLAANPNEDNVININKQDQSEAAKDCVGPNP